MRPTPAELDALRAERAWNDEKVWKLYELGWGWQRILNLLMDAGMAITWEEDAVPPIPPLRGRLPEGRLEMLTSIEVERLRMNGLYYESILKLIAKKDRLRLEVAKRGWDFEEFEKVNLEYGM
jgi:hypothetical protein